MTDFKKHIIDQYNDEVRPEFEPSNWDSFIQYKSERNRTSRKRYLFFLILFGIIIASIPLFLTNEANSELLELKEKPVGKNLADNMTLNGVHKNVDKSLNKKSTRFFNQTIPSVSHEKEIVAITPPFMDSFASNASIVHEMKGATDVLIGHDKNKTNHYITRDLKKMPTIITGINGVLKKEILDNVLMSNNRIIKHVTINKELNKKSFIQLYTGLSFPTHVETSDEQAHQFGATMGYYLTQNLRSKIKFEVSSINYISNTMNPKIGILNIAAPNDFVDFSEAYFESTNFSSSIGLDFIIWNESILKPWVGISYGFTKELLKEIDYYFVPKNSNNSDDEIHEYRTNKDLFFVPNIFILETGFDYDTPLMGLSFYVSAPYQNNTHEIDLLKKVQLNIGISRKF